MRFKSRRLLRVVSTCPGLLVLGFLRLKSTYEPPAYLYLIDQARARGIRVEAEAGS